MTSTLDLDALHYKNNSKSQYSQAYHLLKDIKISDKTSALDIGCGHGHIIGELSKLAPSGNFIGVDPSENMISLASEMFPERKYRNLEFHQMKAEELNFDSDSFDLILCMNAFMWIKAPRKALRLISSLLKTEGQFILFSYSKETPYVQLFEDVLENTFPELKKESAVNTMLSVEEHSKLLTKNHMSLDLFEIDDVVFEYKSEQEFKNYVLGWLSCYVPLNHEQQEVFLCKLLEETKKFREEQNTSAIKIPHKTLSIKASKLSLL